MLTASTQLGPYKILSPLGAGGMGEVYRARDTRLDREVAVKVLPQLMASDPDRLARFEREAKAIAALSHPNILALYDFGSHEAIQYAVMELLEGETLRARIAKGPVAGHEVAEIASAMAHGLAAAHAKGIIHRDLKPENVFLTKDGQVKILDFGLARLTGPVTSGTPDGDTSTVIGTAVGQVMGTPGYMSPEQVRGQPAEATSDLFSLGCVLYEMVAGQRAFQRNTAAETMAAILHEEPTWAVNQSPLVPPELQGIISRCLAKDPRQRLQSARDLALSLRAARVDPHLAVPSAPVEGRRSWTLNAVGILLLVGAVSAGWHFLGKKDNNSGAIGKTALIKALAVLPFENVGNNPESEPLSDGLADHLINSLGKARREGLAIRPFTSVSRYKLERPNARTLGRELNVQVIVTGRLTRRGDHLAVSVEIVDVRKDEHLWGNHYEGTLSGIFNLQDQIARDVATNLRLELTSEEERRLTKHYTEDTEAYQLYLESVYHWNKFTEPALTTAVEYCQRALAKDPKFALAYAGLGRCYILLGATHWGPNRTFDQARQAALQALALDPDIPEAHSILGAIHMFQERDWKAAEPELRQALQGSSFPTYNLYGFYLAAQGRPQEALVYLRRCQEIDPRHAPRRYELSFCYNWLGQYDQAIIEAQEALKLNPSLVPAYGELGLALALQGKHDQAIEKVQQGLALDKENTRLRGILCYVYATAGRKEEAERLLEGMKAEAQNFGFALALARGYAGLGELAEAFHWLERAIDECDSQAIWLNIDPMLANLRSDPRFEVFLQRMGLAPSRAAATRALVPVASGN